MKIRLTAIAVALLFFVTFITAAIEANAADTPRTPTVAQLPKDVTIYTWTGLDGDDTGVPVDVSACRKLTAHVYSGTYGSSTVTVEGSVAATSLNEWVGLTDPQGTAFSKTADAIEAIEEQPKFFRPKTASGTSADIAVGLLCQR